MFEKQLLELLRKHTGHLAAFEDHLKVFESTIVDVHELSSSLGVFPSNLFVQVLNRFR